MQAGSWWRNLTERHHLEELGNDGSIILKWMQNKHGGKVLNGPIWIRRGARSRIL